VWLPEKGWVRVDPTFVVAPDRIDLGLEQALSETWLPGFLNRSKGGWLTHWSDMVQMTWEAVNIRWDIWFMGFSAEDQRALMKRLGVSLGRQSGWMVVMVLPALFIVVFVLAGRLGRLSRKRSSGDQALKIYSRFLKKMARAGLPKAPHQGPREYAGWVSRKAPDLKQDVEQISGLYIDLRYGPETGNASLKQFRRQVRRFRAGRRVVRSAISEAGGMGGGC
jgi:hypothetical protein